MKVPMPHEEALLHVGLFLYVPARGLNLGWSDE